MTLIKAFSLALLGALVAGQEHTASATIRPDVSGSAPAISGTVDFTQEDAESPIQISIRVSGFAPSSVHGVHIHSLPVPANQNCSATGGHFNPLNATHGAQENDSRTRHVGDLGNVTADATGLVFMTISDPLISIFAGNRNVTGLAFVFHLNPDDGGLGPVNSTTLTNGNAGARIACGNIVKAQATTTSTTTTTTSSMVTPATLPVASSTTLAANSTSTSTTLSASTSATAGQSKSATSSINTVTSTSTGTRVPTANPILISSSSSAPGSSGSATGYILTAAPSVLPIYSSAFGLSLANLLYLVPFTALFF